MGGGWQEKREHGSREQQREKDNARAHIDPPPPRRSGTTATSPPGGRASFLPEETREAAAASGGASEAAALRADGARLPALTCSRRGLPRCAVTCAARSSSLATPRRRLWLQAAPDALGTWCWAEKIGDLRDVDDGGVGEFRPPKARIWADIGSHIRPGPQTPSPPAAPILVHNPRSVSPIPATRVWTPPLRTSDPPCSTLDRRTPELPSAPKRSDRNRNATTRSRPATHTRNDAVYSLHPCARESGAVGAPPPASARARGSPFVSGALSSALLSGGAGRSRGTRADRYPRSTPTRRLEPRNDETRLTSEPRGPTFVVGRMLEPPLVPAPRPRENRCETDLTSSHHAPQSATTLAPTLHNALAEHVHHDDANRKELGAPWSRAGQGMSGQVSSGPQMWL